MVESLISDRVIFENKKTQEIFLLKVKKELALSWTDIAEIIKVNPRTLRDWSKGRFNMSQKSLSLLSIISKVPIPKNTGVISWDDHLKNIAKKGGEANYSKNNTKFLQTEHREKQWEKWWQDVGQKKEGILYKRKEITEPEKCPKLAEFVGIMIGDGGISEDRISITLNSKTDWNYSKFVCRLIKELFKINPKIYKRKNSLAMDVIVHSRNIVEFCVCLGLKSGNKLKQNLDIPKWVARDNDFCRACLRGLFDTDGSVFIHKYQSKGKTYYYPKISFTSQSEILVQTVSERLKKNGFNARISRNKQDVRLESLEDVARFREIVGTNNLKHDEVYMKIRRGA